VKQKQILIAADQLANTVFAGFADETISARSWRNQYKKRRWYWARIVIDGLFFWDKDHCKNSYLSEQERQQLPPEYRDNNQP